MVKICCITYKHLDDLVRRSVNYIDDKEIQLSIVEGLREEFLDEVQHEITNGAEVLVAGGANAKIARKMFNVPVLNYKISDFDHLTAIHKGYKMGNKVAIVTYQTGISNKLRTYLESQNIYIQNIIYEDTQEMEEEIKNADVEVVIGAAHAVEIGQLLGKKTVFIYPGVDSILDAIHDAKLMIEEIKKIEEKSQYANTIIRYTTNGIILIDSQERIIDYNNIVYEILGINNQPLRYKKIGDIIKDWGNGNFKEEILREKSFILNMDGNEILEKIIKIGDDPCIFNGAVLILSKLNDIKKAQLEHVHKERKVKKQRGFEAKKHLHDIIGKSYEIKSCIDDAKVFSKSDASVLIYGETGVGKELFAQGIHNNSLRANGPFIAINCGALTESLLEAELFGYDEGAFTGSRRGGKKGLFELAEGGTVFLDEIGEISPLMQTKLLRVLQEHEIMRVGGERIIPINVCIISATNRDLDHVNHEEFRRDLLYRLNVLELHIPPLREREQDAVLLFESFYNRKIDIKYINLKVTDEVKQLIQLYSWPGNIRELQNVTERYCLYLEQIIKPDENSSKRCMIKAIGEDKILKAILSKYEYDNAKQIPSELVLELKNTLSYNREKIAQILGSSRTTIWRIMKKE